MLRKVICSLVCLGLVFSNSNGVGVPSANAAAQQPTQEALRRAVVSYAARGDVESLKKLVDSGYSLEVMDNQGNTPLCASVIAHNTKAYDTLVAAGADTKAECVGDLTSAQKKRFCAAPNSEERAVCNDSLFGGYSTSTILLNAGGAVVVGALVTAAVSGGGGGGGGGSVDPSGDDDDDDIGDDDVGDDDDGDDDDDIGDDDVGDDDDGDDDDDDDGDDDDNPPTELDEVTTLNVVSEGECSGTVINGVCVKTNISGTDGSEPISITDGNNPVGLAEFGGSVENSEELEVSGDSAEQQVALWANGVGADAISDDGTKVDLEKASTVSNSGTLTLTEESSADKGIIGLKATAGGNTSNSGTINLTAKSAGTSAGILAEGPGANIKNTGTISVTAGEKAKDVSAIYAPDRNVANNGDIDITLQSTTAGATHGIVRGIYGKNAVNYETITAKVDENAADGNAVITDLRLVEAAPNGTAANDGTISIDLTNMPYDVHALYANAGATGSTVINNGKIEATGKISEDPEISKHIYLMGSGDGVATLTNKGNINVDLDVSDGVALSIMNGFSGSATNDKNININLTTGTAPTDNFSISALSMQTGSMTNNGIIKVTASGETEPGSVVYSMVPSGISTGSVTNNGLIQMNSSMDNLSLYGLGSGIGNATNSSTGKIYLTTSGENANLRGSIIVKNDESSAGTSNAGEIVLTHNGGSGNIYGIDGGNDGTIKIYANDMSGFSQITGGQSLGGGNAVATFEFYLTGQTHGTVSGYEYNADEDHRSWSTGGTIYIDATDKNRVGALDVVGFRATGFVTENKDTGEFIWGGVSYTRSGDITIKVKGSDQLPGNYIRVAGILGSMSDITLQEKGVISIDADLGDEDYYSIVGMENTRNETAKLSANNDPNVFVKGINQGTINISAKGNKGTTMPIAEDVPSFGVIGMITNSYARNEGTININTSGNVTTAGMVAFGGGVIENKGKIIFTGNSENFTPLYGVGTRFIEETKEFEEQVENPDSGEMETVKVEKVVKQITQYATVYNSGTISVNNTAGSNIEGSGYYTYGKSDFEKKIVQAQEVLSYDEESGLLVPDEKETSLGNFTGFGDYAPIADDDDDIGDDDVGDDDDGDDDDDGNGGQSAKPIVINQGIQYVSEQNGVFSAEGMHLLGSITAGTSLTQSGNQDVYIASGEGQGALIGDGNFDDLELTSNSVLFDASYAQNANNSNGIDIVMTRTSFDKVVDNKSLAAFLEKNYVAQNNETFFNTLKEMNNVSALNESLDKITGRNILSRFAFEDMTMMRELNFDMNNNLFNQEGQYFSVSGEVSSPMTFKGSSESSTKYGLVNRNEGQWSLGMGVAFTDIRSDDDSKNTRKDSVYQLVMPIGYRTLSGFNLMTSPRMGYAYGTYNRMGFNNNTYEGKIEKKIFGLMNEVRYPVLFGKWKFEPTAEFNALGYEQTGSEDRKQYSLVIPRQRTYSVESGVGLYATRETEMQDGAKLKLTAGVMAYHEFADPYEVNVGMYGMRGSFTLADENRSKNRAVTRTGFDFSEDNYTIYGNVISYIDNQVHTKANLGFKWKF